MKHAYQQLPKDQLDNLTYAYLDGGYRKESYDFASFDYTEDRCLSCINVTAGYVFEHSGAFHLSSPMGLIFVAQTAIVHGRVCLKLTDRNAPVWMRHFELNCHEPVRTPNAIPIELVLENARQTAHHSVHSYAFKVAGGKFDGKIEVAFKS